MTNPFNQKTQLTWMFTEANKFCDTRLESRSSWNNQSREDGQKVSYFTIFFVVILQVYQGNKSWKWYEFYIENSEVFETI